VDAGVHRIEGIVIADQGPVAVTTIVVETVVHLSHSPGSRALRICILTQSTAMKC